MQVIGHGIDLVEVERIGRMLSEHGDRFRERCFTVAEQEYAESGIKRRNERYAARFAAKEAVLKALGTGWRSGIAWTDIEIVIQPSGKPDIRLAGRCAQIAGEMGIEAWQVSLTHTGGFAAASVLALAGRASSG